MDNREKSLPYEEEMAQHKETLAKLIADTYRPRIRTRSAILVDLGLNLNQGEIERGVLRGK